MYDKLKHQLVETGTAEKPLSGQKIKTRQKIDKIRKKKDRARPFIFISMYNTLFRMNLINNLKLSLPCLQHYR